MTRDANGARLSTSGTVMISQTIMVSCLSLDEVEIRQVQSMKNRLNLNVQSGTV